MAAPPSPTAPFTAPDPEELLTAALPGDRVDMNKVIEYFRHLITAMSRGFAKRSPDTSPVEGQLFIAPHGSVYKLSINDSGGVNITLVFDSGYVDPGPGP